MNNKILENNLKALLHHNKKLVEKLRTIPPVSADNIVFEQTPQNVPTVVYQGLTLASRHKPLDEGERLASTVDIIENAVVIILGFGIGYHVQKIGEKIGNTGIVIVYEPDLALLRSVLDHVDHSAWIKKTQLVIFYDEEDRSDLSIRLDGAQAIITQGTTILEHPASKKRLDNKAGKFCKIFSEYVAAVRTTILTTLVHSTTTCRNLSLNLINYATGDGINPLKNWAKGHTAILVAAGPSLARNLHLLKNPGIRAKAVIIAVQTMLKPLLAQGIKPHFITALDYHEISKQFYEGLTAADVEGITLVCEPKSNRTILESFPGMIRCTGSKYLENLLGPAGTKMDSILAGATVAHLSFYLAQYLGCDPIVFIGQDLGFTDGLYYGTGAAIHEQWAPELNRFNTIEMMEWQRIMRMKVNLRTRPGFGDRSVIIDEQMETYLLQFERDFADAPQQIIDATEGGSIKQHTKSQPLIEVINNLGSSRLKPIPPTIGKLSPQRKAEIITRLNTLKSKVSRFIELSNQASDIVDLMLQDQENQPLMQQHFKDMEKCREDVNQLLEIMDMVNTLNQLGVYNRLKADRKLELTAKLDEMTRQLYQLERDKVNVVWLADAATELHTYISESLTILNGGWVNPRISGRAEHAENPKDNPLLKDIPDTALITQTNIIDSCAGNSDKSPVPVVAAIIAVDTVANSMRIPRNLETQFLGQSALQSTLERVGRCSKIDSIILLVQENNEANHPDLNNIINRDSVKKLIKIVPINNHSLYDDQHKAIVAARRWCDTSWRGGIGGMSVYDEIICPQSMLHVMNEQHIDAALIVGADWVLVDPGDKYGCDAVIERYLEQPDIHHLVFSQSPPGLNGILVDKKLMHNLARRHRSTTIGAILSYNPQIPQHDPVSKDMCIKLPAAIRSYMGRVTFDTHERQNWLRNIFESDQSRNNPASVKDFDAQQVIQAITEYDMNTAIKSLISENSCCCKSTLLPQLVELELTTQRAANGPAANGNCKVAPRGPFNIDMVDKILSQLVARSDVALTLGGWGDPLLCPDDFQLIVNKAHAMGISAIHVKTDLTCSMQMTRQLLEMPIDVISVNFNADCEETYKKAMGTSNFTQALTNLEYLINTRIKNAANDNAVLALPWIVPTIIRCNATYEDIRNFYDRWIHFLNAALIEPIASEPTDDTVYKLIEILPPPQAVQRDSLRSMSIRADGSVMADYRDWISSSANCIGNVYNDSITDLWGNILQTVHNPPVNHNHNTHDKFCGQLQSLDAV